VSALYAEGVLDSNSPNLPAAVALEIATGLVMGEELPYWQVQLDLGGAYRMLASDTPAGVRAIERREVDVAIVNPSVILTLAYRGTGPFSQPVPVRALGVVPSYDQLALCVSSDTGLTCLEDIPARQFPLRLSNRGQPGHSVHDVLDDVFTAAGFSREDIVRWGGSMHYDPGFFEPSRLGMVASHQVDAVFDEAVYLWLDKALDMGFRVLPLGAATLEKLESIGYRPTVIDKESYPGLAHDINTIDFSGFAIFVHADTPDDQVRLMCEGIERNRERIFWEGYGPLPTQFFCKDTPDGPLDVPLHPAAEAFWRQQGYL